jgi:hypothetical protein
MNEATLLPAESTLEYDESDELYRVRHEEADQSLSTVVVAAVAAVAEADPLELQPLRESVDPDALDDLFASTRGGIVRETGQIAFPIDDYLVVVDASGEIEVHPPE